MSDDAPHEPYWLSAYDFNSWKGGPEFCEALIRLEDDGDIAPLVAFLRRCDALPRDAARALAHVLSGATLHSPDSDKSFALVVEPTKAAAHRPLSPETEKKADSAAAEVLLRVAAGVPRKLAFEDVRREYEVGDTYLRAALKFLEKEPKTIEDLLLMHPWWPIKKPKVSE